jgi:hypothetical protein
VGAYIGSLAAAPDCCCQQLRYNPFTAQLAVMRLRCSSCSCRCEMCLCMLASVNGTTVTQRLTHSHPAGAQLAVALYSLFYAAALCCAVCCVQLASLMLRPKLMLS